MLFFLLRTYIKSHDKKIKIKWVWGKQISYWASYLIALSLNFYSEYINLYIETIPFPLKCTPLVPRGWRDYEKLWVTLLSLRFHEAQLKISTPTVSGLVSEYKGHAIYYLHTYFTASWPNEIGIREKNPINKSDYEKRKP